MIDSVRRFAAAAYGSRFVRGFALAVLLFLGTAQAIGPTTGLQSVVVYSDTLHPLETVMTAASVVTVQTDPLLPLDVQPDGASIWTVAADPLAPLSVTPGAATTWDTAPAVGSTWPVSVASSVETTPAVGSTWPVSVAASVETTPAVGSTWPISAGAPLDTAPAVGSTWPVSVASSVETTPAVGSTWPISTSSPLSVTDASDGLINATVTAVQPVTYSRAVSEFAWEAARGTIGGREVVHKFGRNPAVGATSEAIWSVGGPYNFLTAAAQIRIKAGGNAADVAGGAGAQEVTCIGLLGGTWAKQTVTLVPAGAAASNPSAESMIRVYRCYVSAAGAYGGNNTGLITVETTGGVTVASIVALSGQTQLGAYTVPAGKTAYFNNLDLNVEASKGANIQIWRRENADDATGPTYTPKRLVYEVNEMVGFSSHHWYAYPSFPERTDIWITGTRAGASDVAVTVNFDLLIADNP